MFLADAGWLTVGVNHGPFGTKISLIPNGPWHYGPVWC